MSPKKHKVRAKSPKRSVSIQPMIKVKEHLNTEKSSARNHDVFYRTQNHTPAGGSSKFIALKSSGGNKQNETIFRSKKNSYATAGENTSRTPGGVRFNSQVSTG